jgi:hypothetical protein
VGVGVPAVKSALLSPEFAKSAARATLVPFVVAGAAALQMRRGAARYGLATMCVGVGQGAALLLERV